MNLVRLGSFGAEHSVGVCGETPSCQLNSDRASTWGDAYTVRKRTRNLRTKLRNAYQRKEIGKRMPHFKSSFTTKFIRRFSEIKCSSQTMRAFLSHTRVCSVILRHVLFETCWDRVPFFFSAYAVRIASMILRTARFLCVICAEICVNATAD